MLVNVSGHRAIQHTKSSLVVFSSFTPNTFRQRMKWVLSTRDLESGREDVAAP